MREASGETIKNQNRVSGFTYALAGVLTILLTYKYVCYPIFITDKSLRNAPRVAICLRFMKPKKGDLVSFAPPINTRQLAGVEKGGKYMKRLFANNPIVEYKGNTVTVNGTTLKRDLARWKGKFKLTLDNYKGRMDGYFVLGDVVNSIDSRYFGTVKEVDKCIGII